MRRGRATVGLMAVVRILKSDRRCCIPVTETTGLANRSHAAAAQRSRVCWQGPFRPPNIGNQIQAIRPVSGEPLTPNL